MIDPLDDALFPTALFLEPIEDSMDPLFDIEEPSVSEPQQIINDGLKPPAPQTIVSLQKQQAPSCNTSITTNPSVIDKIQSTDIPFFNGKFTFKLVALRQESSQSLLTYFLSTNEIRLKTTLSLTYALPTLNISIVNEKSCIGKKDKKYCLWSAKFDSSEDINCVIRQILGENLVFTMLTKTTARCSKCKNHICRLNIKTWPQLIFFEDETFIHLFCAQNSQVAFTRDRLITHETSITFY
jgi:hypothetical protein